MENKTYKIGQLVNIYDNEGNCCLQPGVTVFDVDEDTEGNECIEITGYENEDEKLWYSDDEYNIIILTEPK
jgi:hypothetical protein